MPGDSAMQIWGASIDGNVIVLSRHGGSGATRYSLFQILTKAGTDYELTQTITLPASAYGHSSSGVGVVLSGDWLLAGLRRYQRDGGAFVDRGDIVLPAALNGVTFQLSGNTGTARHIVLPVSNDPSGTRLAVILDRDEIDGWVYAGSVLKAVSDARRCTDVAIDTGTVLCMEHNSDRLLVARRDGVSGDWPVVGNVVVPDLVLSLNDYTTLAFHGNRVAIGNYLQQQVTLLSLDEALFRNGFDAP